MQRFLERYPNGCTASPEEIILALPEVIGPIKLAKDLITMEAFLKRSNIHIAEVDMHLIKDYLSTFKKFLTDTWPKHKVYLEKLQREAFKNYRMT